MLTDNKIQVGAAADGPVFLLPQMANRHGLIAGATGTGKTVTLQVLAEGFSQLGVPVFLADVKGDLAWPRLGKTAKKSASGCPPAASTPLISRAFPSRFSTCSAKRGIPSAPRSAKWVRCCFRACWASTTRRPA